MQTMFFFPATYQPTTTYNHPINQPFNQPDTTVVLRQQQYAVLLDLESSSVQSKCTGATTSFVFSPNKEPPNWGSQGGQSKHKAAHITYYPLYVYMTNKTGNLSIPFDLEAIVNNRVLNLRRFKALRHARLIFNDRGVFTVLQHRVSNQRSNKGLQAV